MINNDVDAKDLGNGVILFPRAISLDWNSLINNTKDSIEKEWSMMYSLSKDPETGEPAYMNRSGYFFSKNGIDQMPRRAGSIHQTDDKEFKKYLDFIEDVKDKYLLKYFEIFPLAYKCVWWKVKGHLLEYKGNVFLGSHSDNSVDYVYGVDHPQMQLAVRGVVTCLVYLNSHIDNAVDDESFFSGGEHYFNYFNITYKPSQGDILMFPSNYMAAHEVFPVTKGARYSYLGWYSQGTPNENVAENVIDPIDNPTVASKATNVYLPSLRDDFRNYLKSKGYNESSKQYSVTFSGL